MAVRYGHRKLAGELIKEMKKVDSYLGGSFNALHENVCIRKLCLQCTLTIAACEY